MVHDDNDPVTKILFVDDDPEVLRLIVRRMTAPRSQWDVAIALGGQRGLEELQRTRFDVVVTDLEMPGIDGRKILEAARRCSPRALRVVMTGNPGLAEGCEAQLIISKVDLHDLPSTLALALAESRTDSR